MGNPSQIRRVRLRPALAAWLPLAALLSLLATGWSGAALSGGSTAPEARFRTLSGETLELDALRGQPVLLSFWSTSCVICIEEMPKLKALYHELERAGARMISVSMPYDPPNHVLETSELLALPFPVAIDLDGTLMKAFDIPGTPVQIVISAEGRIAHTFTGRLDYDKTLSAVTRLIRSP